MWEQVPIFYIWAAVYAILQLHKTVLLLSLCALKGLLCHRIIYFITSFFMFKDRKITSNIIREKMNIKNSVLDYIRYWYGHVQRMDEERLPRRILEWYPLWRKRKGRPQNSWMQKVTTGIRERGIWQLGMGQQRGVGKKNKFTLGTERCENIKNLYI